MKNHYKCRNIQALREPVNASKLTKISLKVIHSINSNQLYEKVYMDFLFRVDRVHGM